MMVRRNPAASGVAAVLFGFALHFAPLQNAHAQRFNAEQIQKGSATYAQFCANCHNPRMEGAQGPLDLTKFPKNQRNQFIKAVFDGKGIMPPWRGAISEEEAANLWAYVITGEKR